jgi:hypothetical protein
MTLLLTDSETNLDKDLDANNSNNYLLNTITRPSLDATAADPYTMKIVLTLTVHAPSQEQAEVLASHVAAFLPEDAQRLVDAFSPVIMLSPGKSGRTEDGHDSGSGSAPAAATAAVTMVAAGEPVSPVVPPVDPDAPHPSRFQQNSRSAKSHGRTRGGAGARPTAGPRTANRALLYTRSSF